MVLNNLLIFLQVLIICLLGFVLAENLPEHPAAVGPVHQVADHDAKDAKPDVKDAKPEGKDAKPEVKDAKSDVKDAKPEVKDAKPEVKDEKAGHAENPKAAATDNAHAKNNEAPKEVSKKTEGPTTKSTKSSHKTTTTPPRHKVRTTTRRHTTKKASHQSPQEHGKKF